ncbi:MAG: peptidylprolyl isomerase [Bacteroidaceae bacterium]|nr:peptidylprolyl isomerase [Bacteroidaceae bacterium]
MKKITFIISLMGFALTLGAQVANPVLMEVNGKKITKAEFEYSYNKNNSVEGAVEHKTVEEYVQMYVDYKLKVAEAESLRFDTLTSFVTEFRQYRDMQLTPLMVDTQFIDSIARLQYADIKKYVNGADLLRPAHILLMVKQNASESERQVVAKRADSIYNAILAGADFAEMAQKFSEDRGTARNGGLLPWIGPGNTIKEFETAAYALQPGQMGTPILSPVGYHIILMKDRKTLESYDLLKDVIIDALKQQGIEEASAEAAIKREITASNGKLTREDVMLKLLNKGVAENPELQYLVNEYYDGLLLYEVAKTNVWDKAANDMLALENFFKANKKAYVWDEPRFDGFVVHANDKKVLKKAKSILKKNKTGDWRKAIQEGVNKDSVVCLVQGPYLCKKGENKFIDAIKFKGEPAKNLRKYSLYDVVGKMKKQPTTYIDVKSQVVNDYTQQAEKVWVEGLRKKYQVVIHKDVLETLK